MRYFSMFNPIGRQTHCIPLDGMPYATKSDVLIKFPSAVEITEEEQNLYVTGEYLRIDGLPIKKPPHVSTAEEIKQENNAQILSQIRALEATILRPLRELNSSLVTDKSFAQAKVDSIEQQIQDLRAQLK